MVLALLGFNLLEAGDQPRTETSVRLVLPADATPVAKNLCTLLTRRKSDFEFWMRKTC